MLRASSKRTAAASAGGALAASLALAFAPTVASAQTAPYVAPEARVVEPARPVAAILPQERIAASIELGRILFPSHGGGALGSLIIASTDRNPEKLAANAAAKADVQITPLVEALGAFDAGMLAHSATAAALDGSAWIGAGPPELFAGMPRENVRMPVDSTVSMTFANGSFGSEANDTPGAMRWQDAADHAQRQFAAAHQGASELASVTWRYEMSPDFTFVRVIADIALRKPGAAAPSYGQQLISVVKLHRPGFVEEESVARWAAGDAALARTALTSAFVRAGEVLPHILALDAAGYASATDLKRESVTSAGYHGPVLLRDDKGPVFYARDDDQRLAAFVAVQTIRD